MLSELLKSLHSTGEIMPILQRQAVLNAKQDRLQRKHNVFHPSEICGDFCPRSWLLLQRYPELYSVNNVTSTLQMVFDVGKVIHRYVQELLGDSGVLYGVWRCARYCNGKQCVHYGFKPPQDMFNCSIDPIWQYCEVPVLDKEYNIAGSTDGIVLLNSQTTKYVFEFKTINDSGFKTLAQALVSHKEQAGWYMDVLERNRAKEEKLLMKQAQKGVDVSEPLRIVRIPYSGVINVYMNKNDQQLREFVELPKMENLTTRVTLNDNNVGEQIQEKKKVLKQTLQCAKAGELMPRLEHCTHKTCNRARKCLVASKCFE